MLLMCCHRCFFVSPGLILHSLCSVLDLSWLNDPVALVDTVDQSCLAQCHNSSLEKTLLIIISMVT